MKYVFIENEKIKNVGSLEEILPGAIFPFALEEEWFKSLDIRPLVEEANYDPTIYRLVAETPYIDTDGTVKNFSLLNLEDEKASLQRDRKVVERIMLIKDYTDVSGTTPDVIG